MQSNRVAQTAVEPAEHHPKLSEVETDRRAGGLDPDARVPADHCNTGRFGTSIARELLIGGLGLDGQRPLVRSSLVYDLRVCCRARGVLGAGGP